MPGVLNCGYLAYAALASLSDDQGWAPTKPAQAGPRRRAAVLAQTLALAVLQCGVVPAPFLAFQAYGYLQFCRSAAGKHAAQDWALAHAVTASCSPGGSSLSRDTCALRPAWCSERLPYLYGHVQSAYWDVGFLRSYRPSQARCLWKLRIAGKPLVEPSAHRLVVQVPNILLAAPVLVMSAAGCAAYWALTWRRGLGLAWLVRAARGQRAGRGGERGYGADAVAPYVLHWAFATAAAALVLHVQVKAHSSATSLVHVTVTSTHYAASP